MVTTHPSPEPPFLPPPPAPPEHPLGVIWTVYPRDRGKPMIANGQSSNEPKARALVESVLQGEPEHSAWGLVISAYGTHDKCTRAGDVLTWSPLWSSDADA